MERATSLRRNYICPQCDGRLVWRIEKLKVMSPQTGAFEPLGVTQSKGWLLERSLGFFEAFICKGCGFTELYADGIAELQPDEKRGVHLIDNRPKIGEVGPVR